MEREWITLDVSQVDEFVATLPRHIFNAQRSATRTTTTFARKRLQSEMAVEARIPARVFRRYRIKSKTSGDGGTVWFGFDDVSAAYVGNPKQFKHFARSGKHRWEGGFVATMRSGHKSIFRRSARSRLPIDEQFVEMPQSLEVARVVAREARIRMHESFIEKVRQYSPHLR
jgi:hypothetical protein